MSKAEIIATLVSIVLIPLATWLVDTLVKYLKEKTDNARLNKYYDIAADAVLTAVAEVMQTYVSTLKKEGKWTDETAAIALEMAKSKALDVMGAAAFRAIGEVVVDTEAWLTSKIEAAIRAERLAEGGVCVG
jgi:hypothetical protein